MMLARACFAEVVFISLTEPESSAIAPSR
jgi:hypothetical protein